MSFMHRSDKGIEKKSLQVPSFQMKTKMTTSSVQPTMEALTSIQRDISSLASDTESVSFHNPIDASLTRDSSSKAFMRELRKVIERSDVIIQVLDARDPEGTRSRWVEDEVRKRDLQGKKLLGVLNKIDLVPRANLESWLKHLRHSFPTMPFKSSTQNQGKNLSQNALPTTSASLGAPALLNLLKQYALSTPHSSLTVGVVGYPNVGKSSLVNSLKRSRACAVAAMPGKTRIVQEVVLDKGVRILDCPGVVLEDIGSNMDGEEGKRKQAEMMLRNCVKAELIEDPISPVDIILSKIEPAQIQKIYNIPPYDDVRDFLIKVALTRGRLGKGGIPDLESSAVQVLRDWNSGKLHYHTNPPKFHPSSASASVQTTSGLPKESVEMNAEKIGDAKILSTLSEAFTIEGLFDDLGEKAAWTGQLPAKEEMDEDADLVAPDVDAITSAPVPTIVPAQTSFSKKRLMHSDSELDDDSDAGSDSFRPLPPPNTLRPQPSAVPLRYPNQPQTAQINKMFTPEELAVLGPGLIDRKKQKNEAKKAKKQRAAIKRTEGELMAGFLEMDMDEREAQEETHVVSKEPQRSKKEKRREKKQVEVQLRREAKKADAEMEIDNETRKEADFANFLANIGGEQLSV
nr:nuclear GTP-binding protein [Cryptococcus depauperatus CBS 7855]